MLLVKNAYYKEPKLETVDYQCLGKQSQEGLIWNQPSCLKSSKVQIFVPSLANLARLNMFCNQAVLPCVSSTKQGHEEIHTHTYTPVHQFRYENS